MKLTKIAIERPSLIIVIFLILILTGIFSYTKLNYELMPEFSQPTLIISTQYPGADPSNVEQSVSKKLEDVLSGVDGLKSLTTQSYEGMSLIVAEFKFGVNIDEKQQEVQRKFNSIIGDLPEDIKTPNISKVVPSDQPILQLQATSMMAPTEFYDLIKSEILPQIQQISGVGQVTLLGGQEREIQVNLDKDKLDFYNLSILQVTQKISKDNLEFPTGKVKDDQEQMTVRLAGRFQSAEDISEMVIYQSPSPYGSTVRLKDVATVSDILKEPSSINRYNGINGIGIIIKKQSGSNAVEISKAVHEMIDALHEKYQGIQLNITVTDDSAIFTMQSVDAVQHDLMLAVILVAAIMLLFLHSLRDSLIVLLAIPTSLISTFLMMNLLGYSLNLMTLLALSLVIGILVDDSIVILENIHRHLHMGKPKRTAALDGRTEIGFSALAITTVDVVVFGPIALVNTTISPILRQFSLTIVVSTLMSLFVCYTLTPWLASRFAKIVELNPSNPFHNFLIQFEKGIEKLTRLYESTLKWVLNHRLISATFVLVMFAAIGLIMQMGILGNELVAAGDQGKLQFKLEYDKSATLQENNLRTKQVEDYLLSLPEVKSVFSNIAGPSTTGFESLLSVGLDYKSELVVQLVDKKDRQIPTEQFLTQQADIIPKKIPGIKVRSALISMISSGEPIQIILKSEDYDLLMATAHELKNRIENIPGTNDVSISVQDGNPEIQIDIDRTKMGMLGLDVVSVGATIQNALSGNQNAKFRANNNEYDINIKFDQFDRQSAEDVKNIKIINNVGKLISLSQFATVTQGSGPSMLERRDRRTSVTVKSNLLGATTGVISAKIDESIEAHPLPPGVDFKWTGDVERQAESFNALSIAFIAAFIFMYLVMVALYDSFVYPFVVLFSIPVAFIGAFLALNLASSSLSMFTILGMIMLLGLVAKNAILIVDFANHKKMEGVSSFDSLVQAGGIRLRPILMTTIAMVAGMLPIALAKGAGSEWKNGLGWVLVGGLTSSMVLTVYVVPMAYYTVDKIKIRIAKWSGAKQIDIDQTTENQFVD
ncbi:MAG: efflux RND transporter permease subunit [Chitinophagales bacterium]|nr:efflux RND transporter permease subunit [Chitinophagales bacterium]